MVNPCEFFPPEDPQRIAVLTATFGGKSLATDTNKELVTRLRENAADRLIATPVIVAQGLSDAIVPPAATAAYVNQRCVAGQQLEYWQVAGQDHGGVIQPGTLIDALLIAWMTARFSAQQAPNGCTRKSF